MQVGSATPQQVQRVLSTVIDGTKSVAKEKKISVCDVYPPLFAVMADDAHAYSIPPEAVSFAMNEPVIDNGFDVAAITVSPVKRERPVDMTSPAKAPRHG